MLNEIPQWLRSFRVEVLTDTESIIFDSWSNEIKDLKFDDTLGGQVGTNIKLFERSYKIDAFQIITDMTTDQSDLIKDRYLFQINIFVIPNDKF